MIAAVLAVAALAASIVLVMANLLLLLALIVPEAVAVVASRHALGRDTASIRGTPGPGTEVGPAARAS